MGMISIDKTKTTVPEALGISNDFRNTALLVIERTLRSMEGTGLTNLDLFDEVIAACDPCTPAELFFIGYACGNAIE